MWKTDAHRALVAATLVSALTLVSGSAESGTHAGFLGLGQGATDVWALTCPPDTRSVRASVNEGIDTNNIKMGVLAANPVGRAATAVAKANGTSDTAILEARAGNYWVAVFKNRNNGEGYGVTLDCHDAGGVALGVEPVLVQDQ